MNFIKAFPNATVVINNVGSVLELLHKLVCLVTINQKYIHILIQYFTHAQPHVQLDIIYNLIFIFVRAVIKVVSHVVMELYLIVAPVLLQAFINTLILHFLLALQFVQMDFI